MKENNHLCDLWEHTIVKVFKHDSKSQLGLILNNGSFSISWKISTQYIELTQLMILHHLAI